MTSELVLLTGISGFIAKHVALALLDRGYRVRGTVRSLDKRGEVMATLSANGGDVSRIEIAAADLTMDAGWEEAAAGCRFVQHTASPFPGTQPRHKFGLVPAAKGGTVRVVEAAKRAGVQRLVLTSSVAAVYCGHENRPDRRFGEGDFSNIDSPAISPYAISKTEAETAAWAAVAGSGLELAVINPALVLGPLLGRDAGTSADLIAMMMKGRMPAVPDMAFGIVDARDVALAHCEAMERPEAAGRRFILSAGTRSLLEMAQIIAAAEPSMAKRVPGRTVPDILVRALAMFSSRARLAVPELGRRKEFVTEPAKRILAMRMRSPEEAITAMASSLASQGLV